MMRQAVLKRERMLVITSLMLCVVFGSMIGTMIKLSNKETNFTLPAPRPSSGIGTSDQSGDEWPMFHGALNHTGTVTTTPVQGTGPIWNYTTNGIVYSSPAVSGEHVYVGSSDGKVYCLDAITGTKIWNYDTGTGSEVDSSPAVAGNYVYVGSYISSKMYCLNAATGASVWNYTAGGYIGSSPAVAGGHVYVGCNDDKVYCLNAATGASIWNYTTGYAVSSSPAVAGGYVYVGGGSLDKKVYCLNTATGAFVWSYTTGSRVDSSPAVAGGRVYVSSADDKIYCLYANNGSVAWSYISPGITSSSPAVVGGYVYVGKEDNKVYCLNAATGALSWTYTTCNYVDSSPAVASGFVYVGSEDDKVYCLNAATGAFVWSYTTGGLVRSSPAVAGGRVYVGSYDDKMYCFPMIILPSAPKNLQAIRDNRQVMLLWQAFERINYAITGYRIYRGTKPGGETLLATIGNMTNYTNTGLTNGVIYYYTVAAVNSAGVGANATEVSATPSTVPTAPLTLTAKPGAGEVVLTWAAPSDNGGSPIVNYEIYRGTSSGNEIFYASAGNVTTFTDASVTSCQAYYYEIRANNSVGIGAISNEFTITVAPKAGAVVGLTFTQILFLLIIGSVFAVVSPVLYKRVKNRRERRTFGSLELLMKRQESANMPVQLISKTTVFSEELLSEINNLGLDDEMKEDILSVIKNVAPDERLTVLNKFLQEIKDFHDEF